MTGEFIRALRKMATSSASDMNTVSLDFESKVMVETFQDSFLLVASKGLCVERLFYKHLQLYSDASVLVLVMNASSADFTYFRSCLAGNGLPVPKHLTSETPTGERKNLYLQGGVQFVTTRILIADLLCERIPVHLVTGVLVYRAHTTLKSALESFVLRNLRRRNAPDRNAIFIKAFSDSPQSFCESLGALQRACTALRVSNVLFLPRFHQHVVSELDSVLAKPKLVELAVTLSPAMKSCQQNVTELIQLCVQELKRCQIFTTMTDRDTELTFEAALLPWFEAKCRRKLEQLSSNIHEVPDKVKRLLDDIGRLKQMLNLLETEDGKAFTKMLDSIRKDPREHRMNSGWLFTPTAETLYEMSKKRSDEVPSKWDALKTVLEEFQTAKSINKILIIASDESVCNRLKGLIWQEQSDDASALEEKAWLPTGSQVEVEFHKDSILTSSSAPFSVYILRQLDRYNILQCLNLFKPNSLILYNSDIWIIRQIEAYNISRANSMLAWERFEPLLIYLLMYDKSVEEQRYLSSLQQEKISFEKLFKEETTLLFRKEEDEVSDVGEASEKCPTIIVDMREFRSELPTLLHSRNMKLVPATLIVGDYVLSPQICVERKAPQDLVQSLQSGRLFSQCRAMCLAYERPLLLIELQPGRRGWRRFDDRQSASKLAVLAVAFPQLRFVWAPNPSSAAELFVHFKFKRDEPDVAKAGEAGKNDLQEESTNNAAGRATKNVFSNVAQKLLAALPGVSSKHVATLMRTKPHLTFRDFCKARPAEKEHWLVSKILADNLETFLQKKLSTEAVGGLKQKAPVGNSRKRK